MKFINKDLGSYNLHFIKTDLYKTITLKIVFHNKVKKDSSTYRNILTDILLQSTKNYPTRRDISIASENLYALDIYVRNSKIGPNIYTTFTIEALKDKYTEKGNFEKCLKFLSEVIFSPDVEDGKFKKDKVELVKNNLSLAIDSIKDDPTSYSIGRLYEEYDKSSPISYSSTGYKDVLEEVNEENLYKYYKNMLNKDLIDIFVVGDIEEKELLKYIKEYFKFRVVKKRNLTYSLDYKKPRKNIKVVKEKKDINQSVLLMALPVGKLKDYDRDYSLLLGNLIFGGGADSKLFKNVREKNSLCYSIGSIYSNKEKTIIIMAGIDSKNEDKAIELIKEDLTEMKKGHFTDNDLKVAKEYYSSSVASLTESPNRVIAEVLKEEIYKDEKLSVREEKISKVTKKDIVRAFKKVNIDTIYLLEGSNK